MTTAHDVFAKMQQKFDATAAGSMSEVFQYHIDGQDWHVVVDNGRCEVLEGAHDDPSVTLTMSADTLAGVATGEVNGMQAFMSGDIKASGDVMLATRLTSLFPAS